MSKNIRQWVTLELTYLGEKKLPEELTEVLRAHVDEDLEIFVPAVSFTRKDNSMVICLMEGYAFVEGGRSASYYLELENLPYIKRVLTRDESTGRYLIYVPESEIEILKKNLLEQTSRQFEVGDTVEVIEGSFKDLGGKIIEVNLETDKAFIQIDELVSIDTIVELPLQYLAHKQ